MRIELWALALASVVIISGCVPTHIEEKHVKYDPTRSKAMNIALLTGLTHAERGPLKDGEPASGSKDGGMSGAAMANLAAGSFDLLSGGGGLGVVTSFMFKTYQPEWTNHVFAWMPKDLAKDEADAAQVMCNIMHKAMKQITPKDTKLVKEEACSTYRAWMDDQRTRFFYKGNKGEITGLVSSAASPQVVTRSFLSDAPSYYWSYMKTNSDTSPVLGFGLWFSDTYGIKESFPNAPVIKMSAKAKQEQLNTLYKKVSPLLPSWVYIYIAPNRETGEPAHFLNKGESLYFITPKQ